MDQFFNSGIRSNKALPTFETLRVNNSRIRCESVDPVEEVVITRLSARYKLCQSSNRAHTRTWDDLSPNSRSSHLISLSALQCRVRVTHSDMPFTLDQERASVIRL